MKSRLRVFLLALSLVALMPSAHARDVRLPNQRVSICVGKSGVVMRTKTQLEELVVNGLTSPNSTFYVQIRHAKLTCDFDTAESIVARCTSPGTQTIDTLVKTAYADPNRYRISITIDCRICPGREDGGGVEPMPRPKPKPGPGPGREEPR